jgi:hypothetical protein
MKRILVAGLATVAVSGAVFAFAASLTVTSGSLGAGSAAVSSCTSGVTTSYNLGTATSAGYPVTSVAVSGVAASCQGKVMSVSLRDSTGNTVLGSGTATLPASCTTTCPSQNVNVSGSPAASAVANVDVAVNG